MALQAPSFLQQFFTDEGLPAAGHMLHTYESGTTTDKVTYADQDEAAENENPIVLDAAGRCNLWLETGEYTFVLNDPDDTVTLWTRDDIGGMPEAEEGDYLPLAGGTMTGAIVLAGNAVSSLQAVPKQQLDASISALSTSIAANVSAAVPIGTVALWLTSTAPTGWLHLNGQAVSRTTYATLFALWGETFGEGDNSTTFNVADVRGEFPRFWDSTRGVDAGRAIGTAQTELLAAHTHDGVLQEASEQKQINFNRVAGSTPDWATGSNEADTTGSTGGAENRPRNFSFMGIVRAL
jgi:microcystin-dependent protein